MKKWILLLSLPAMAFLANAQNYIPKVTTYTTKDGLSSNEIHAIHKDKRGFMWIGTQYGLNRFDGRGFKIYTKENKSGLEFNNVNKILEDETGNLWLIKTHEKYEHIYTSVEINLLNIYNEKVQPFEAYFQDDLPFKVDEISFITQLDNKAIFIECNKKQKVYLYHTASGFVAIPFPKTIKSIQNVSLKLNGNIMVVGLKNDSTVRHFEVSSEGEIEQEDNPIRQWTIYDEQQIHELITTGGANLDALQYLSLESYPRLPEQPLVSSIYQTNYNPKEQLFWLRNVTNLFVVQANGRIVYQKMNFFEAAGETPILFQGNVTWLSNRKDGLMAIHLAPNHFETYQFFEKPIDNSMRGVIEDKTGTIWFSTVNGIGQVDIENQISILYTKRYFTPFIEDKEGYIWHRDFKTVPNQLVRYAPGNNQITASFPIKSQSLMWALFEADNGEIWMGGDHSELIALDPLTGITKRKTSFPGDHKRNLKIYHFQKRDERSVWVCTSQGLYIIDWNGNIIAGFKDQKKDKFYLPAKDIHHLHQEEDGVIWIATGDAGLFQIKEVNGSYKVEQQFTTENGLSSNALHAVYADNFDYLWISSDDGLIQLDKQNGQISKYFQRDGLAHDEFNRMAHYQGKDGKLYFGGINGLTVFDPEHFSKNRLKKQTPILAIADYQQFSGEKKVFENLTASLLQTHSITLQPNDRFFKIKLAVLDFEEGKNSTYHYRIKGLYDWQSTSNNELNFNSLPYGNHKLEIKAQNGNLQNASNDLKIDIKISRPFYLQWWFVSVLAILLALGVWLFFKRRTRQLLVRQEAAQLRELDKMKSRFFANISHELRTPLTLIGLPLEHLLKNLDQFNEVEIRQYIQSAYSNKEDLNRLINEILNLSKLEAGKLKLEKKSLPLNHFLNRAVHVFRSSAHTKGIDLQFSSTLPEDITVRIDDVKMEMVINNLLSNALKFTTEGGSIKVNAEWMNACELQVTIQDTGRGIPAEDLPYVFERYFQAHQSNSALEGGSGIGLAICKEFVELMGGKIRVDATLGIGSVFSFQLPLEVVESKSIIPKTAAENKQTTLVAKDTKASFSKEKSSVLIVEDHFELQQHLQNILSPFYNVLTASNGAEALKLLENPLTPHSSTFIPDLILSDVMMPKMDGFTLLEKVRSQDEYCGIPFILLTARADMEDKLKGLRIGVDAYMTKPFEIEELQLRIKNLLANASNRKFIPDEEAVVGQDKKQDTIPSEDAPVYQPTKVDIEWLQQVETIAMSELHNKNFKMEDLAKALLIGHRSMHRRIKQITGLTPNRYIRSIRLHQAKKLLETQQVETQKEVALAVGFDGSSHFSKLFEAEFGKHPQYYLKKQETL